MAAEIISDVEREIRLARLIDLRRREAMHAVMAYARELLHREHEEAETLAEYDRARDATQRAREMLLSWQQTNDMLSAPDVSPPNTAEAPVRGEDP